MNQLEVCEEIGQRKKDIYCNIWMAKSEFGINDIKAWIHTALYQWLRLLLQ